MTSSIMPARSEQILWRETDGSVVLFFESTGRAFVLDEVASAAWLRCDGRAPVTDVAASLALAEEDMRAVLAELAALGCLAEAGEWGAAPSSRRVEEIVFAACDCSSGGRGVMRNAECTPQRPQTQVSTI